MPGQALQIRVTHARFSSLPRRPFWRRH